MVSEDAMFESLSKTAQNRKRLSEMIRRYVSVAVLRLGMDAGDIVRMTGYTRSQARSLIDRIESEAHVDDRLPAKDPVSGKERIERELPDLILTHQQSEDLVQKIARLCVLRHGMSANELARRTGHSRDYTQKWVKQMRAEPAEVVPERTDRENSGWYTPRWDEDTPVDPKYIITAEEADRRRLGGTPVRDSVSEQDAEMFLI